MAATMAWLAVMTLYAHAAGSRPCPCATKSLCDPIRTPLHSRREVFGFGSGNQHASRSHGAVCLAFFRPHTQFMGPRARTKGPPVLERLHRLATPRSLVDTEGGVSYQIKPLGSGNVLTAAQWALPRASVGVENQPHCSASGRHTRACARTPGDSGAVLGVVWDRPVGSVW